MTQAPPTQTPGEVAEVESTPTPEPTVTPTVTPAPPPESPNPTPSIKPESTPTVPVNGPDIKPYAIEGNASIVVENQVSDYKDIKIKAGVTNSGNEPAADVVVELKKGTSKLYTWNIKKMAVSAQVPLEVTIGEILISANISAGVSLTINCVAQSNELKIMNNWVTQNDLRIAVPPVQRSGAQTAMGKKVQEAIDNSTWYTEANKQELLEIVKDILKGIFPYWNYMQIYILPYDEYNDLYFEKVKTKASSNRISGNIFFEGYINGASIYVREGTFYQVIPDLINALGIIFYAQKNFSGYQASRPLNGDGLAGCLYEAHSIALMREKYGLAGLMNASVQLDGYPKLELTSSTVNNALKLWVIAAVKGYPEGGAPAKMFLEEFNYLTTLSDPSSYITDLSKNLDFSNINAIDRTLSWRMVDKELTMLPEDTVKKIDPDKTQLSLDMVIVDQTFILYPW